MGVWRKSKATSLFWFLFLVLKKITLNFSEFGFETHFL